MSDGGRRTKQWGDFKGPTKQANATAALLRRWLDDARLRLDDVRPLLTPEHFSSGRVPSRSTISERLAGVRLEEDFVQAIADVCSGDDAALRKQLLQEAAAVASREHGIRPPHGAARNLGAAVPASELVAEQRRSLALQDRLLRAMERAVELEHERTGAHRMVCVLLTMVDKLQRDITTLSAKSDKLQDRADEHHMLDTVRKQLARSEQQRRTAEASLQRAREERSKADRLAEEAAEQIRALTAELEQLRQQAAGQPDNSPPVTASHPAASVAQDMEAAADDIDDALVKASRHLDDGARRLDDLARELHQDNASDNPAGPLSACEEAAEPRAKTKDPDVLVQDILQMLRRMREGRSSFVDLALTASADFIIGLMDIVLRYGKDEEDWEMAYDLLEIAAAQATPSHICALIAELRTRGGEMYAHRLLSVIATERLPMHVVDIVAALRESQQPADAYQLLNAVGRDRPAWYIQPIVLRLSSSDAMWLLDAVTAERTPFDIATLRAILRNNGQEQYAELLPALTLAQAAKMPSLPFRSTTRQLVT